MAKVTVEKQMRRWVRKNGDGRAIHRIANAIKPRSVSYRVRWERLMTILAHTTGDFFDARRARVIFTHTALRPQELERAKSLFASQEKLLCPIKTLIVHGFPKGISDISG